MPAHDISRSQADWASARSWKVESMFSAEGERDISGDWALACL